MSDPWADRPKENCGGKVISFTRHGIIAYDVSEGRARAKILRILKRWSLGGQKSIHECRLTTAQAEELFLQLLEWINPETDLLLLAWLEPQRQVLCRGLGRSVIGEKLWVVG